MPTPARLTLRVVPRARRPGLAGRYAAGWKLRVAAPPEDGRANRAVRATLAGLLGVTPGAVRIVRGHGGRDKLIEIVGVGQERAEAVLDGAAEEEGPRGG
jgi:uncharacterized protein YggU (UPF0235/DUF167 family)